MLRDDTSAEERIGSRDLTEWRTSVRPAAGVVGGARGPSGSPGGAQRTSSWS